jgi:glycosyltransferase involved in cell wall biosynthesis
MMGEGNRTGTFIQTDELVILGICRDVGEPLTENLERLQFAFNDFSKVHMRVVESDSSDSTVEVLRRYRANNPDFDFESLGMLESTIPDRWERIAFCRNRAAELLLSDIRLRNCRWVVVADLDGINSEITPQAVISSWSRSDWDVCTANQGAPYYDVFALRHPTWSPNDCWRYEAELIDKGTHPIVAREVAIYSRQKLIPIDAEWVPVDSAFGGLAIYKREFYLLGEYAGKTGNGARTCEHVPFHEDLKAAGARIYINPTLINSYWNEHNYKHSFLNRAKRRIKLWMAILGLSVFLK